MNSFVKSLALLFQLPAVKQHALSLHVRQHFQHGQFNILIKLSLPGALVLSQLSPEYLVQAQHHIRTFRSIFGDSLQVRLIECNPLGPLADNIPQVDGLMLEVLVA